MAALNAHAPAATPAPAAAPAAFIPTVQPGTLSRTAFLDRRSNRCAPQHARPKARPRVAHRPCVRASASAGAGDASGGKPGGDSEEGEEEEADPDAWAKAAFGGSDKAGELLAGLRRLTAEETTLSNAEGLLMSHELVKFDAYGEGPRARYVYVEERDCIGCTHCASTAGGTFFLEGEWGRARVFDQVGDVEPVVEEAIDTCPVNCIYYVSWEDLVTLERARRDTYINNWARLVGGQDFLASRSAEAEKRTTIMDSGIMRCANCPSNGCKACPMYGVGENPEYMRRMKVREERLAKRRGNGGQQQQKRQRRKI